MPLEHTMRISPQFPINSYVTHGVVERIAVSFCFCQGHVSGPGTELLKRDKHASENIRCTPTVACNMLFTIVIPLRKLFFHVNIFRFSPSNLARSKPVQMDSRRSRGQTRRKETFAM